MNIGEATKADILQKEVEELNNLMNVLRDYGWMELKKESSIEDINKLRSHIALYIIRTNNELKQILKEAGLDCFVD